MVKFCMKARVEEILSRHAVVGLAVGVVRNGQLEFFRGHVGADIVSNTPVTEDTVFPITPIIKTFATITVMQLWEQRQVDRDAPANDYLRACRLTSEPPARDGAGSADPHGRSSSDAVPGRPVLLSRERESR